MDKEKENCFFCPNKVVTSEFSDAFFQLQGISHSAPEKTNILNVICQLIRVKWKTVESLLSGTNNPLPFCLTCLKQVMDLMSLRQQLSQIESDIREKIKKIESSIAQIIDPVEFAFTIGDWEDGSELELSVSYEDYRKLFQKQVMREYWDKTVLKQKTEELTQKGGYGRVKELTPSLVQLQLPKNVFHVFDEPHIEKIMEYPTEPVFDVVRPNLPETSKIQYLDEEFLLGLVNPSDDAVIEAELNVSKNNDQVTEDYDCSPSKKFKCRNIIISNGEEVSEQSRNMRGKGVAKQAMPEVEVGSDSSSSLSVSDSEYSDWLSEESGSDEGETNPAPEEASERAGKSDAKSKDFGSRDRKIEPIIPNGEDGEYMARDGTMWSTKPPKVGRTMAHNILRERGGLLGAAKNPALTPEELFKLFIPPSMIDLVVKYTNEFAKHEIALLNEDKEGTYKNWTPFTRDEIYAYIGIFLYLGAEKKRNRGFSELWSINPKYALIPVIAAMPRDRAIQIQRFIMFDDFKTRENTNSDDFDMSKMGYISEVFGPFMNNIQSYFSPSEALIVDEMVDGEKYRSKTSPCPGMKGIRIWQLCDSKTGYVLRLCFCKWKAGQKADKGLGKKVVLGLVQKYFKSGRTVSTGPDFASQSLARALVEQRMSFLGRIHEDRMEVIPEFPSAKGRQIFSSIFAFQKDFTMASYIQSRNKAIVILSSEHHSKSELISDYRSTRRRAEPEARVISPWQCQYDNWPLKLFQSMCDIASINAAIIHGVHHKEPEPRQGRRKGKRKPRLEFLLTLVEGLIGPQIETRGKSGRLNQKFILNAVKAMGYEGPQAVTNWSHHKDILKKTLISKMEEGRHAEDSVQLSDHCNVCSGPLTTRKLAHSKCGGCRRWICREHMRNYSHCYTCNVVPTVIYEHTEDGQSKETPMETPNTSFQKNDDSDNVRTKKEGAKHNSSEGNRVKDTNMAAPAAGQRSGRVILLKTRKCVSCRRAGERKNANTACNKCGNAICQPHQNIFIFCDHCLETTTMVDLEDLQSD